MNPKSQTPDPDQSSNSFGVSHSTSDPAAATCAAGAAARVEVGVNDTTRSGPAPGPSDLRALADRANAAHREAQQLCQRALAKWVEIGDALLNAKDIIGHGDYTAWVEGNCDFGERQARKYRKLAELWAAAGPLRNSDSVLEATSLEEVISLLRSKGKTKKAASAKNLATATAAPSTYDPFADKRPRLLWTVSELNKKTGLVLTSYVGPTLKHLRGSCEGCALLEQGRCYAWTTLQRGAAERILNTAARDLRYYDLANAVARYESKKLEQKVARLCAIGDPARVPHDELIFAIETLKARGYSVLAYTHHWREKRNQRLKTHLLASCNSPEEADEALALGWLPAVVLPSEHKGKTFTTPGGAKGIICPEKTVGHTCGTCRLCTPDHPAWANTKFVAVAFPEHGNHVRRGKALPVAAPIETNSDEPEAIAG